MKSFKRGDIVLIDVPIVGCWQQTLSHHDCSPSYLQVKENGNAYPCDCHGKGH